MGKKADLVLPDEMDARNMAEICNLHKTGVPGFLIRAKKYQMINEVKIIIGKTQKTGKISDCTVFL